MSLILSFKGSRAGLVNVPSATPDPIFWERYATNSLVPSAQLYSQLACAVNFVLSNQRKLVFVAPGDAIRDTPTTLDGERTRWRFAFRSGHAAARLRVEMILAQGFGVDPYGKFKLRTFPTNTLVDEVEHHYGAVNNFSIATLVPSSWARFTDTIDIDPSTVYTGEFLDFATSDGALPTAGLVAARVYEEAKPPDLGTGWLSPFVGVTEPIFARHRREIFQAATKIYKKNGSHLLSWTADEDADAPSFTTTTPRNIIDNVSTAPSDESLGPIWDLRYRNTLSRTQVRVAFFAFADAPFSGGTTTGVVQLRDSTGAIVPSSTITFEDTSSPGQWLQASASLELPATEAKYDLMAYRDGGAGTFRVRAASAYLYLP